MANRYLEIQQQFKIALNQQIQAKNISVYDGLSLLWIFGQINNESDFFELAEIYKSEFNFLSNLINLEKEQSRESDNMQDIQIVLSAYLKNDAKNGLKVAEYVAKNPNVTLTDLLAKFPELNQFTA